LLGAITMIGLFFTTSPYVAALLLAAYGTAARTGDRLGHAA
jgi:hypothetical protein